MPDAGDKVDLTLVIDSVDELYSGLAPRLCPEGLFIESDDPAMAGSSIGFRVVLADGVVLIQGRGSVLWTRLPGSIEGPPGMAVQFDDLDGDTRETIDAVIDAHLSTGGELFDLDEHDIRDVYPTDVLDQSADPAGGSPKWRPDDEIGEILADASASYEAGTTARGSGTGGVLDLRFSEAIAGFTPERGPPESGDVGAVDQAIAAAVVAPATADGGGGDAAVGNPADAPRAGANGGEIPDILHQWREELELASPSPDRVPDTSRSDADATPWESLLPFIDEDDSIAPWSETGAGAGAQISSARRASSVPDHSDRLMLVLAAAAVVFAVATAMVLLGVRGEPPSQQTDAASASVNDAPDHPLAGGPPAEIEEENGGAAPAPTMARVAAAKIVRAIEWSSGSGVTEVVIRGDGRFGLGQVDAARLTDPPRVLVRVRRIDRPYTPSRIDVGSPEVVAVRIGHHPELSPPTLYVVLDLAEATVSSADALKTDGDVARVTVRTAGR